MFKTTAPWKTLLEKLLNDNKSISKDIFNVAVGTIENNRPKVRIMVHRGFASDSNILLSTTDIRMQKVNQFEENYVKDQGTPLEYVFWIEPAMCQLRIQANAFLLPSPQIKNKYNPTPLPNSILQSGIDFESERVKIWDEMSDPLRAAFAKPVAPGSNRLSHEDIEEYPKKVQVDKQDKWYNDGLERFTLVIIDPIEVDYCDLKIQPNQRKIFRKEASFSWSEKDVEP